MIAYPPFLPESVAGIEKTCHRCGAIVKPNFWEEFDEPFTPIHTEGINGEKFALVRVGTVNFCVCGEKVDFPLDAKRLVHPIYFYGDDADRLLDHYHLHSYSVIGGTSGPIQEISDDLTRLKIKYIPSVDPNSWRIHVTEMLNSRKRITHGVYKNFSRDSLNMFFLECAEILRSREKMTWNRHVTAIVRNPKNKKNKAKSLNEVKQHAHNALLSLSIFDATKQKLRPVFTFDASKPVMKSTYIEGWSFNSYSNSRRYIAHAYLTHSNDISPPVFVKPGSHPCLELADVHAYFSARCIFERYRGDDPEFPLSKFGTFRYMTVQNGEKIMFKDGDDIPINYHPVKSTNTKFKV